MDVAESTRGFQRKMLQQTPKGATIVDNPLLDTSRGFDAYTPERLQQLRKDSVLPKEDDPMEEAPVVVEPIEIEDDKEEGNADADPPTILNANEAEALEEEEDEEDEEVQRWEMQQIKKGGAVPVRNLKPKPAVLPIQSKKVSIADIQRKLKQQVDQLRQYHAMHQQEFESVDQKLQSAVGNIDVMDVEYKSAADELITFQELRDYINDLCDCLSEKVPIIEEAEDRLFTLDETYHAALQQHWDDILRRHGRSWDDEEIQSTFDQDRSRSYQDERESKIFETRQVFGDVFPEYSSLDQVKQQMENWREKNYSSYIGAWVGLSLPNLFAPYVRFQTLDWEPLSNPNVVDMDWYRTLASYLQHKDAAHKSKEDVDDRILPQVLEKVIYPKLTKCFLHVWNPRSKSQNELAIQLWEKFSPISSQDFLIEWGTAVLVSFRGVLESLPSEAISLPNHATNVVALIRHIGRWLEISAEFPEHIGSQLQSILVDDLVNSKILPFFSKLNIDAQKESLKLLISCIPSRIRGPNDMPFLHYFIQNLEKRSQTNSK
eukprot:TRINITY_DN9144_c0_g2_i2.p1 TRINITY_DN9144_c0_g2~~TRINITY_DN9144_c0_g2_i2.p1  ORF type:complete len:641 (-),score=186.21 TRINITY_DN9144_c0_g2_i2:27-1664(-)